MWDDADADHYDDDYKDDDDGDNDYNDGFDDDEDHDNEDDDDNDDVVGDTDDDDYDAHPALGFVYHNGIVFAWRFYSRMPVVSTLLFCEVSKPYRWYVFQYSSVHGVNYLWCIGHHRQLLGTCCRHLHNQYITR